jgi:hypothetical protein
MQLYDVHCRAAERVTARTGPYFRRFLEMSALIAAPDSRPGRVRNQTAVGDFECDLYFDPVVLTLSQSQLDYLLSSDAEALAEANAYFLPPIRIDDDYDDWTETLDSSDYFAPATVHLRRSMLSAVGFDGALVGRKPGVGCADDGRGVVGRTEPSLISLSRILDDPLLHDILLDGGTLRLVAENTKPTRWTTQFGRKGSLAQYRSRVFLDPQGVEVAEWPAGAAARVGDCLHEDLRSLAPFSLLPEAVSEVTDWSVADVERRHAASAHRDGSYPLIVDLGKRLAHEDERDAFQRLVTWAAAPVHDEPPSHDLAERNLVRRFLRCPWLKRPGPPWEPADEDWGRAWIDAIRQLLYYELRDKPLGLEERVAGWSYMNCRLVSGVSGDHDASVGAIVHHSYKAERYEVLAWRLLLPLGTVLRADRTICLDDPVRSAVDRGFVLG